MSWINEEKCTELIREGNAKICKAFGTFPRRVAVRLAALPNVGNPDRVDAFLQDRAISGVETARVGFPTTTSALVFPNYNKVQLTAGDLLALLSPLADLPAWLVDPNNGPEPKRQKTVNTPLAVSSKAAKAADLLVILSDALKPGCSAAQLATAQDVVSLCGAAVWDLLGEAALVGAGVLERLPGMKYKLHVDKAARMAAEKLYQLKPSAAWRGHGSNMCSKCNQNIGLMASVCRSSNPDKPLLVCPSCTRVLAAASQSAWQLTEPDVINHGRQTWCNILQSVMWFIAEQQHTPALEELMTHDFHFSGADQLQRLQEVETVLEEDGFTFTEEDMFLLASLHWDSAAHVQMVKAANKTSRSKRRWSEKAPSGLPGSKMQLKAAEVRREIMAAVTSEDGPYVQFTYAAIAADVERLRHGTVNCRLVQVCKHLHELYEAQYSRWSPMRVAGTTDEEHEAKKRDGMLIMYGDNGHGTGPHIDICEATNMARRVAKKGEAEPPAAGAPLSYWLAWDPAHLLTVVSPTFKRVLPERFPHGLVCPESPQLAKLELPPVTLDEMKSVVAACNEVCKDSVVLLPQRHGQVLRPPIGWGHAVVNVALCIKLAFDHISLRKTCAVMALRDVQLSRHMSLYMMADYVGCMTTVMEQLAGMSMGI